MNKRPVLESGAYGLNVQSWVDENTRLKRSVAVAMLDNAAHNDTAGKTYDARREAAAVNVIGEKVSGQIKSAC